MKKEREYKAENAKQYIRANGKLSKAFKKKWLNALTSGKYTGTTGNLCKVSKNDESKALGYCCLGVAGHMQGIPNTALRPHMFLNEKCISYAKKPIPDILIGNNRLTEHLAGMNDNKQGFKRIAQWIDKYL